MHKHTIQKLRENEHYGQLPTNKHRGVGVGAQSTLGARHFARI